MCSLVYFVLSADPDVVSFLRCVKSIAEKFVVLRKVGGGQLSGDCVVLTSFRVLST